MTDQASATRISTRGAIYVAVLVVVVGMMTGCRTKAGAEPSRVVDSLHAPNADTVRTALVAPPAKPVATSAGRQGTAPVGETNPVAPPRRAVTATAVSGALAVSLALALLVIIRLTRVMLRWRRDAGSGMEAVVPSTLLSALAELIDTRLQASQAEMRRTQLDARGMLEVARGEHRTLMELVRQLRQELDSKDQDLERMRNLIASAEQESYIRSSIRLHSMLNQLAHQIGETTLAPAEAFAFLEAELRDVLDEKGVAVIAPETLGNGAEMTELFDTIPAEQSSTIDGERSGTEEKELTRMIAPAYGRRNADGTIGVIRKGRLISAGTQSA
jgi:hypothetical protein